MPRQAKNRRQATTTSKNKLEPCQVDIDEPEKIIGQYKRKVKEEAIRKKKVLSRVEPPVQNCDQPRKLSFSQVEAIDDVSSDSSVVLLDEIQTNNSNYNTQYLKKDDIQLPSLNLDVLETTPSVLEQKQKVVIPQMKSKYNRRTKVCDAKTNENKNDSSSSLEIKIEDVQLDQIEPDIQKCETQKSCSPQIDWKKRKSQIVPSNPIPHVMESAVLTLQEQKTIAPRVKRKYNRQTKACDTKFNKNEDELSAISNSNPDVLEVVTIQEQKPDEPQVKRKYNRQKKGFNTITNEIGDDLFNTVCNSNPEVLELVDLTVEEQKSAEPRVKRKYNRQKKACDTITNKIGDDLLSTVCNSNPEVLESVELTVEEQKSAEPRVKRKYNKQTKVCDTKTNKNKEDLSTVSNSNSDVLESAILTDQEQKPVMPHVKRKYNRQTKVCDTTIIKIEDDHLSTISNSNPDVLESAIVSVQEEKPVEPRAKRKYNRQTKVDTTIIKIEDDHLSTVSNSNPDVSESDNITVQEEKPVEPLGKRKYNRQTKVCDTTIIKIEDDHLSNFSNSNPDVLESAIVTVQEQKPVESRVKRKYTRRSKVCDTKTNKNEDDHLSNVSNSNPDVSESAIVSVQEEKPVEPRVKRKYNRQTKVCDPKTNKNEDDLLNTISNSDLDIEECKNISSLTIIKSEDLECQTLTLQSTSDDILEQPEVAPRVKRKYTKRANATDTKTHDSQSSLNPSLEDKESRDVSAQTKHGVPKRIRLCSDMKDGAAESESSHLNPDRIGCKSPNAQDIKKVTFSTKGKREKRVTFAPTKPNEFQSIPSNIDSVEPEIKLEFLPIITKSCKEHVKRILLTAVQFQRHSRRKRLSEADVSKALAFHGDFKVDSKVDGNVEYVNESESVSDEEDESAILPCHGKWLHQ